MDITLNQYIDRANEIKKLQFPKTKNTNELKTMIATLENTLSYIKTVHKSLDTTPTSKEILPVKPSNIVQWHPELNQYSIKINNLLLRGNYVNIYNKHLVKKTGINIHQIVACEMGNKCKNILDGIYCKFWHDPVQLLELKNTNQITEAFYLKTIQYTRNFVDTAWVYDPDGKPARVRTFGSKSTLTNDISLIKVSEHHRFGVEEMKQQVVHDLLVLLALNENGIA
jgi:hypothetical protein